MEKQAFFLGCVIPLRFASVEVAARRVFGRLNIGVIDLEGYTCCPEPVALGLADEDFWVASAARNLALAEKAGADLVVLCNGCYETLAEADYIMKHSDETRSRVNELLAGIGSRYEGRIKVKHFIEFLHEDVGLDRIKQEVTAPIEMGLAVHYGCHLFREADGGDPWRKPMMMRALIEASGAQLVDYGLENLCCGFPTSLFDREFSLKQRLLTKLESIEKTGEAEAIVFTCPACINQFETGQDTLLKGGAELKRYPCLHFMELLALSFGVSPAELNLELHSNAVKEFAESYWR